MYENFIYENLVSARKELLDVFLHSRKRCNLKPYDVSNTGGQSHYDLMKNKFKLSVFNNNSRIYRAVGVIKQSIIWEEPL